MGMPRIKSCLEINTQPTLPDANGYTWVYDSTREDKTRSGTAIGKTAGLPTPGNNRGGAKNSRIMMTVGCTGQNVTLLCYRLDGAGAWQLYDSTTITAGNTPQGLNWTVLSPDVLIGILGGATPPTTITTTFLQTEQV
jgi:hypothetical protein